MKHFWALPAFLRVAVAAQPTFNVLQDLLAFPQYVVVFPKSYIHAADAASLLARKHIDPLPHLEEDVTQQAFDTQADLSVRGEQEEASYGRPSHERDTYERLILNSRPHLCTIPYVAPPGADNTTAIPKEEEQEELARATDHGLELLKDMQGSCIYYSAGWWVYSFCYNEGIRQFHPLPPGRAGIPIFPPVEDRNVQSYILGQFPKPVKTPPAADHPSSDATDLSTASSQSSSSSTTSNALITRGESNYLTQSLTGGTICDLTAKPRRIDIQYHCNPNTADRIALIKETSSCVYLMVIHTPRLCNDVAFQPPQVDKPNEISCREIISNEEEEAMWHKRLSGEIPGLFGTPSKAEPEQQPEQDQHQDQKQEQAPLIIGGIRVGARLHAGSTPETTIRASNIVLHSQAQAAAVAAAAAGLAQAQAQGGGGGANAAGQKGQEEYIATLAKSDGRYTSSLSEPEMNKLGLKGTREELEKWVRQMQDMAGEGTPWKLDVVRTADGMEFRGIVLEEGPEGTGEEEGEGEGGGGEVGGVGSAQKAGEQAEDGNAQDGGNVGSQEEYKEL